MSRKKTHLEYVEHKEYVNTKQGICISVLTFRIKLNNLPEYDDMLWDFEPFKKYIDTLDHRIDDNNYCEEYIYWTVRGKSICSENDKFDEELGKHIALTRAQEKAFITASKFYRKIFHIITDNLLSKYDILQSNCFCSSKKEAKHVHKLIGIENVLNENKEAHTI